MQTSISARHRAGVMLKDRMGYLGGGVWMCSLGMPSPPINPHPPPPPSGANRLTFYRWRKEGKGGNSSEGLAAGLYLRVKKWTRNCSEDIKKSLWNSDHISVRGAAVEVSKELKKKWNFFLHSTVYIGLCIWHMTFDYSKHSNGCIIALLLFVLCL